MSSKYQLSDGDSRHEKVQLSGSREGISVAVVMSYESTVVGEANVAVTSNGYCWHRNLVVVESSMILVTGSPMSVHEVLTFMPAFGNVTPGNEKIVSSDNWTSWLEV